MTINEEATEHLAELARVKISGKQKEKLACDLGGILGHFQELTELDTRDVLPVTGGTDLMNVLRNDEENDELLSKGKEAFPEKEKGFLKVPAVFDKSDHE